MGGLSGSDTGGVFTARRGIEKILFRITIVFSVLFFATGDHLSHHRCPIIKAREGHRWYDYFTCEMAFLFLMKKLRWQILIVIVTLIIVGVLLLTQQPPETTNFIEPSSGGVYTEALVGAFRAS